MIRNSFKDANGKQGTVGSKVQGANIFTQNSGIKTVKRIISRGRGGTRIDFVEGLYGNPKDYYIIDENTQEEPK